MYYAVLVILLSVSSPYACQSYKESPIDNSSVLQRSYFDSHGRPILGFGDIETDNPVIYYPNKIDISCLGTEFIKHLMENTDCNKKTIYYERSLNQIENHFLDVQGYLQGSLKTRRVRQTKMLIDSCQNVDKAASRFLNEMGGKAWEVKGWQILRKT